MDRLQKKCLIVSVGMHGFLLLVLLFGSAFFVSRKKPLDLPAMRVVPQTLVDAALSGGGGDPKVAPSSDKIKGETLVPQPTPPPQPVRAEPPKPQPQQSKPEPTKLALVPTTRKVAARTTTSSRPLKLTPVNSSSPEKPITTSKTDNSAREKLAQELGKTVQGLRSGFSQGTAVNVNGPGGAAFANYAQWVKQVYEDAWIVSDEITDEDSTAKVTVTISRSGHVTASRIERRSGNPALDKSVERTLARVRFVAPFPEGSTDAERTFTINFNLKAKRLAG